MHNIEDLRQRIVAAFNVVQQDPEMFLRATRSIYDRALLCSASNEAHFENSMKKKLN